MCVMGFLIGVSVAAVQFILLKTVVLRITKNRYKRHEVAALLLLILIIWAVTLAGAALISLADLLWAAGTAVVTTFVLAFVYFKKNA